MVPDRIESAYEAVLVKSDKHIGSVAITHPPRVIGLLTERDQLRQVAGKRLFLELRRSFD